jgi:8-oxo-dGTP pyrophosphatase MutT (NUDIX family)
VKIPRPFQAASRSLLIQFARREAGTGLPIQAAALPWRIGSEGRPEVLLITSRSSGRWMIPKGQPENGKSLADIAAKEAFEEAGVRGVVDEQPIGRFEHVKSHWIIGPVRLAVLVHKFEVQQVLPNWPEQSERRRCWLSPPEAAELVASAELSALLRIFTACPTHCDN